ncbi:hypothetical protein YIM_28095 [Amycolatopsis sp. YIM 10]|nr:hypothetical protein YIM_28095 [Amycolatopsis sp. YIM 10]
MFTVASIFFQFTIGLALAVFFNDRFPLSGLLRSLLLLPWLLPLAVSGAPVSVLCGGAPGAGMTQFLWWPA